MKFDDEICKGISCPECSFNKGEDGCLLAKRLDEIEIIPEPCEDAQPEIIRCNECKHYKFADNRAFGFPVKRCEWTGFEDVDDDDFCSRAERRTDELDDIFA